MLNILRSIIRQLFFQSLLNSSFDKSFAQQFSIDMEQALLSYYQLIQTDSWSPSFDLYLEQSARISLFSCIETYTGYFALSFKHMLREKKFNIIPRLLNMHWSYMFPEYNSLTSQEQKSYVHNVYQIELNTLIHILKEKLSNNNMGFIFSPPHSYDIYYKESHFSYIFKKLYPDIICFSQDCIFSDWIKLKYNIFIKQTFCSDLLEVLLCYLKNYNNPYTGKPFSDDTRKFLSDNYTYELALVNNSISFNII